MKKSVLTTLNYSPVMMAVFSGKTIVDARNREPAHGECGRILEGLWLLDEGFRIATASGSKRHVPELHRIRGKLRSKLDPRDPLAEDCFRKALDVARSERTRSLWN
jgi:hypothetical protein